MTRSPVYTETTMTEYIPERGDVIILGETDNAPPSHPTSALVLSNRAQNMEAGDVLVCPLQDTLTGNPYEVPYTLGVRPGKALAADRIQRLTLRHRRTWRVATAPRELVKEVTKRMVLMMG